MSPEGGGSVGVWLGSSCGLTGRLQLISSDVFRVPDFPGLGDGTVFVRLFCCCLERGSCFLHQGGQEATM